MVQEMMMTRQNIPACMDDLLCDLECNTYAAPQPPHLFDRYWKADCYPWFRKKSYKSVFRICKDNVFIC